MPIIKCEMCGSTDIIKQDGVFVCQSCGIKYSLEEAKKLMVEVSGTVEVKGSVKVENAASTESLLKRAFMMLEDGEFNDADELFDNVLNMSPECGEAYVGKLMAEIKIKNEHCLQNIIEPLESNKNYQKILKYCSEECAEKWKKANADIIKAKDRHIQKLAMDTRRTQREIAENILRTYAI